MPRSFKKLDYPPFRRALSCSPVRVTPRFENPAPTTLEITVARRALVVDIKVCIIRTASGIQIVRLPKIHFETVQQVVEVNNPTM
ncbi:unnamed protein product [Caenorhabditis angaria]|uniref:Uncharacterized protein n=1 Tax=Caenorhabditis angaria TaxID=860376 RepID=A0A9P1IX19_9PELO|nr:unnamed protein product [Caenorhabditis angaria]